MFDLFPEYLRPQSAFDRAVTRLIDGLNPPTQGTPIWTPNPGPQSLAFTSLADELFYGGSAGGGKALDVDTPIPTPNGYVRMGDLQVGDQVYGTDGKPCEVVAVSPVMNDHQVFNVLFEDGSGICADADHQWTIRGYFAGAVISGTFSTRELSSRPYWTIFVPAAPSVLGSAPCVPRLVVDIRAAGSVPVRCITVKSPDHLYLAGTSHIPTHNSDLLLGLAATQHTQSVIFRRVYPSMRSIVERSRELYGRTAIREDHIPLIEQIIQGNAAKSRADLTTTAADYNGSEHVWRFKSGNRVVEFSSIQHEWDKEAQRGRPRDFYGWDEITEFSESQYIFVNAWNRSTRRNQRCRVVATGNPPTSADGEWVIRYWAPWLDPQHPRPAKPGELRWYVRIKDQDVEVEDSNPVLHDGEQLMPRSRTFIPAKLSDNPYLAGTGYLATLQALPEPLRSQMLFGDFNVRASDPAWQTIPTAWVIAAQDRWRRMGRPLLRPRAVGVDVARGGVDNSVVALLLGNYFELHKRPGRDTPTGASVADFVAEFLDSKETPIAIDIIGVGSSPYDTLAARGYEALLAINNSSASAATDKTGVFGFVNLRAESYWMFREALDPDSGEDIALPPDNELIAELCAPRYKVISGKYQLEPKEEITKRLGRSPDLADAVVMAWYRGTKREETRMTIW